MRIIHSFKSVSIFIITLSLFAASSPLAGKGKEPAATPKYLWFDAEANFERFASRDSITYYLEKAKKAGFNQVVVDVKPIYGGALYKSEILPPLTVVRGKVVRRDWDYLRYFLDEARRLGLGTTVSASMFTAGNPVTREGLVYADSRWDGKTCMERRPDGQLTDIRDNGKKVAAFLNPVRKEVREWALAFSRELVTNYDFDGYALDYCRFPDDESDFSETTRQAFEEWLGRKVDNFPDDIYTYQADGTKKPGRLYKEWWAFRAHVISSFVKEVREVVKSVKPQVRLEYWAASWLAALYRTGQNWASPKSDFALSYPWGSEAYRQAGFAPYLDRFLDGTYLHRLYGMDDPESIEYGIDHARKVIAGDCQVIGTLAAPNHRANLAEAIKLCLDKSGGVMVFDIVNLIELDQWDDVAQGLK
ncbi:MAG: family 10 glycosylhydrolase [Mediterranea sp.]|jgi:hypothetical protein|nr:family 10 glycosylhydrolase [Mediterranea sp.]